MDELFRDLPLAAQTNFAELLEQARIAMLGRSIFEVPGSFNQKIVKGATYWYWQYNDLDGVKHQVYLGPDDDRLRALIQLRKEGKTQQGADLRPLAAACASLGCMTVTRDHFKVIGRLARQGFFSAGGVLVGTHAFLSMSNMLGVRWMNGWKSNDIDFAHPGANVSLGLPSNLKIDLHDAITSLEMGLLPARSLQAGVGATYFDASGQLRIDLLTTVARAGEDVYRHPQLNANLQPLKFMEFSLEHVTQTVLISGEDAVIVNVPSPMRFALHKLMVMALREDAFQPKVKKDAGQVAALVGLGLERMPHQLNEAAKDLVGRGKTWRSRAAAGLRILRVHQREVAERLAPLLEASSSSVRR